MDDKSTRRTGPNAMPQQVEATPDERGADIVPIDTDLQAQIGRQLRAIYDGVLNQPIPDRFLELLDQLDATEHPKPAESVQPVPSQTPPKDGD